MRQKNHNVSDIFLNRHSPRKYDESYEISLNEIQTLFEAARWAPSSYNEQPWKFVYAKKGDAHWTSFFELLVEFNQGWVKNCSLLCIVLSSQYFSKNEKPNRNASSDTGAAWQNLALQAHELGLEAHAMAGFDVEKAVNLLQVDKKEKIEFMFAVGKPLGDIFEELTQRKEQPEFVFEGKLKARDE